MSEFRLQPRLSQKHPNNPGLEAECVASAVKDLEVGRLSWIEPNVMTRILVKELQECQHQRRQCKDRSRGCSDVATSHRMQAAGRGKGAKFPQPFRRHASLPHLPFSPVRHVSDF